MDTLYILTKFNHLRRIEISQEKLLHVLGETQGFEEGTPELDQLTLEESRTLVDNFYLAEVKYQMKEFFDITEEEYVTLHSLLAVCDIRAISLIELWLSGIYREAVQEDLSLLQKCIKLCHAVNVL